MGEEISCPEGRENHHLMTRSQHQLAHQLQWKKRHARAFYEGKSLKSRECARDGKTPISWDQDGPRSSLTYLPHPYTLCRVVYTLSKATWGDVVTIGQSLKAMIFERISSFSRRFSTRSGT